MNLIRDFNFSTILASFTQNARGLVSQITEQQKKVAIIATAAITVFALAYCVYKRCTFKAKPEVLEKDNAIVKMQAVVRMFIAKNQFKKKIEKNKTVDNAKTPSRKSLKNSIFHSEKQIFAIKQKLEKNPSDEKLQKELAKVEAKRKRTTESLKSLQTPAKDAIDTTV